MGADLASSNGLYSAWMSRRSAQLAAAVTGTGRNPQIQDTGVFNLVVGGITSSTTVTSAVFLFGTGLELYVGRRPSSLIGYGFYAPLAVGGVLVGGKLLEPSKRRCSFRATLPDVGYFDVNPSN
jgi:hypothetical protein